jgi:hypothetical protein
MVVDHVYILLFCILILELSSKFYLFYEKILLRRCLFVYRYLLEVNKSLMYRRDNLNRTALHYSYGVGDRAIIEFLSNIGIDKMVNLIVSQQPPCPNLTI